jgi:hypothetical protein
MNTWFAPYIQSEMERFIPSDPFEEMVTMLGEGTAFSFSRFGDGEFNAILGVEGSNCDGHPYYPDLGLRLKEIVQSRPCYLMGLQALAVVFHGARQIHALAGDLPWVLADSLHLASGEGRFDVFFEALAGREVMLVGPGHLGELSGLRGWSHCPVPARDCWKQYGETYERIVESLAESGHVVLLCASMMSNVLIDDLYGLNPANTYIDAGSVFDPYAGVKSRTYHRELGPEAMRQIEAYGTAGRSVSESRVAWPGQAPRLSGCPPEDA